MELGYTPTRMPLGMMHFRRYGMPFISEPPAADCRHRARLPGDRRDPPARSRARARRLPRAAVRMVHEHAGARRGRRHRSRAARVHGLDAPAVVARRSTIPPRSRPTMPTRPRRAPPRARPRTFRARPARATDRCAIRPPRSCSRADRRARRGRRLSAHRGLRRADRESRRDARARAARRGCRWRRSRVPLRSGEPGGGGDHGPQQLAPDRDAAERAMVELLAAGQVRRTPIGDDALWQSVLSPAGGARSAAAVSLRAGPG